MLAVGGAGKHRAGGESIAHPGRAGSAVGTVDTPHGDRLADPANGYRQRGVRLGAARQWRGTTATVFISLRHRDYAAWSPLLEARRQDEEQTLIAILRSERLAVAGLVPSLSLRCARIDSNVGWLYSHDRSLLSLKWERAF